MTPKDASSDTTALSAEAKRTLALLADLIIPASAEFNVPGAGDATILADILTSAAPHGGLLSDAMSALDELAKESHRKTFTALEVEQRAEVAEIFKRSHRAEVGIIVTLVAQCYYRDDRVMRSLDMEPRPPHPEGYTLKEGDWSLLDPVRSRPKIFRKVP